MPNVLTRAAVAICLAMSCASSASADDRPARVDAARMDRAPREGANWLSYGRTYDEQRFSPLAAITPDNAGRLGLAWFADLDTNRGQEATPLVIDGVMYFSTAWSLVKAYDAKSGKLLWSYDPEVPKELGVRGCCDVVSRGVAAWNGKIYLGAFDGRLIALDAKTGRPVWSTRTVGDSWPATITQAPRVVKGRVIVGYSGGEYGVRGYISAYDAETGKLAWRFHTVPGDPSKPFENAAMAKAAKTWSGEWWKMGGGGTVWDAISYDPQLNLVYFGIGNGLAWSRKYRSDDKGDNLFLSSIVALNADSGEYVWHYQVNPGEEWDYDAVGQLTLADLAIDGRVRQVLMQANKNGFFYVIDRRTGKLISAQPYVPQNWATRIDLRTGRPVEHTDIHYSATNQRVTMMPGPDGGHSWHPMAYSPKTGLVYIPAQEIGKNFDPVSDFKSSPLGWNLAVGVSGVPDGQKGYLLAWDPAQQREVWRHEYVGPWNGGIVATAGNLVVQGDAGGHLHAYRADDGKQLWSFDTQTGVMAAPITYEVDGEQYIAVVVGWGSAFSLQAGTLAARSGNIRNVSRVLAFKVGGNVALPPAPEQVAVVLDPPPATAAKTTVAHGEEAFARYCSPCHGENAVGGGVVPDLRASRFLATDFWYEIVLNGAMRDAGMAPFKSVLGHDDVEAIRAYVIKRANDDKASAR